MRSIASRLAVGASLVALVFVVCGCDETYDLYITSPSDGWHFSGTAPYDVNVRFDAWAGAILGQAWTAGTVYVNGAPVATWEEKKQSSHPFMLEATVQIQSGANVIRIASDNGEAEDAITVYLDP